MTTTPTTITSLPSTSATGRFTGPKAMLRFLILGLVLLAVAVSQFMFVATATGSSILPMILVGLGAVMVIVGIVKGVRRQS
jgi:hypothetical protein